MARCDRCPAAPNRSTSDARFERERQRINALVGQERSTLEHLAVAIGRDDYEPQKQRLEALGLAVTTATHGWVHWRSIYLTDPEGNTVELVCYEPKV